MWEMAIKRRMGKLPLPEPVASYVARRLAADAIADLPVTAEHAAAVETLELLHRDPFDRICLKIIISDDDAGASRQAECDFKRGSLK